MSKDTPTRKVDPARKLGMAVAEYLRLHGWKVIATGPSGVRQLPGKHKYEFVLQMMALKKDGAGKQRAA